MRDGDTAARLGGDEFAGMLASDLSADPVHAAAQADFIAQKMLSALDRPYDIAGQHVGSSASIGVALFSNHQFTVEELLRRADQAMYEVMAAGRTTSPRRRGPVLFARARDDGGGTAPGRAARGARIDAAQGLVIPATG